MGDQGDYPVLSATHLRGSDLAAAKIAHEFGHVKRTASLPADEARTYQQALALSAQTSQAYAKTRNPKDPAFLHLAGQVEAVAGDKRSREHWAEANVIPLLIDKHGGHMPKETRCAIDAYRKQHPGR